MKAKISTICGASLALILATPVFAADSERAQATTSTNDTNIRTETATPQTAGSETSMRGGHGAHEGHEAKAKSEQRSAAASDLEPIGPDEFVETASAKGMAEVETAKIALEKAQSPEVREFAQRMIEEHKASNEKLKQLAQQKDIKPSKEPNLMDKAKAEILEMRDGESFDEAYINNQIAAHEQTIELYERAAQSEDQALSAYAEKSLPMLRDHMQEVKDLQEKVVESVAQSS